MDSITTKARLYVDFPLKEASNVSFSEEQNHYLRHVIRLEAGQKVALFNGHDGEWLATLEAQGKKQFIAQVQHCLREQYTVPDIWLVFAPIKFGRIDFLVQKVTELGASALYPVITQYTQNSRINQERLFANAIEAAEQSERLEVPQVAEAVTLEKFLGSFPEDRILLYGDESGQGEPPLTLLPTLAKNTSLAILIGPEGGFSLKEQEILRKLPYARALTLGPRVMRADTAALAALTVVQAWCGDWHNKPRFQSMES